MALRHGHGSGHPNTDKVTHTVVVFGNYLCFGLSDDTVFDEKRCCCCCGRRIVGEGFWGEAKGAWSFIERKPDAVATEWFFCKSNTEMMNTASGFDDG